MARVTISIGCSMFHNQFLWSSLTLDSWKQRSSTSASPRISVSNDLLCTPFPWSATIHWSLIWHPATPQNRTVDKRRIKDSPYMPPSTARFSKEQIKSSQDDQYNEQTPFWDYQAWWLQIRVGTLSIERMRCWDQKPIQRYTIHMIIWMSACVHVFTSPQAPSDHEAAKITKKG